MKVIKFYTYNTDTTNLEKIIWYIDNNMKQEAIISKVELFLRQNKLSCYMSAATLYGSYKDFDEASNFKTPFYKLNIEFLDIGAQ